MSKTIALTPNATPGDVAHIYQRAFDLSLKGVTVFRHGSKPGQVIELGVDEQPYEREHASKCDPDECRM